MSTDNEKKKKKIIIYLKNLIYFVGKCQTMVLSLQSTLHQRFKFFQSKIAQDRIKKTPVQFLYPRVHLQWRPRLNSISGWLGFALVLENFLAASWFSREKDDDGRRTKVQITNFQFKVVEIFVIIKLSVRVNWFLKIKRVCK